MRVIVWFLAAVLITLSGSALAGRAPCSGARGGIIGCDGVAFMCADGAVSQSKKSCQKSDYAKVEPVADVVASVPEKASYTIISWIAGAVAVLAVVFALLVWGLFRLSRWVLRNYNAKAEKVIV